LRRIDLSGRSPASLTRTALAGVLPRASTDVEAAVAQIRPLCEDVRNRGAAPGRG
jgi:histidinol dehydrogenase